MSTTHTVPQHILDHPGFITVVSADSTGYYEQHKEVIYAGLLAMCETQERLQMYLDGVANNHLQTIGDTPTEWETRLNVGLDVQMGFNYRETGVFVQGDPQLVVEMSLLPRTDDGSYSVVQTPHGLRGLEEEVQPSGSTYFVSVEDVFRVKCKRNGQVRYTNPFIVPGRA